MDPNLVLVDGGGDGKSPFSRRDHIVGLMASRCALPLDLVKWCRNVPFEPRRSHALCLAAGYGTYTAASAAKTSARLPSRPAPAPTRRIRSRSFASWRASWQRTAPGRSVRVHQYPAVRPRFDWGSEGCVPWCCAHAVQGDAGRDLAVRTWRFDADGNAIGVVTVQVRILFTGWVGDSPYCSKFFKVPFHNGSRSCQECPIVGEFTTATRFFGCVRKASRACSRAC